MSVAHLNVSLYDNWSTTYSTHISAHKHVYESSLWIPFTSISTHMSAHTHVYKSSLWIQLTSIGFQ